ncbi:MAG: LD-carboxypeptidase [Chloroflexi bacterium]|nr:LD-carboxypeptidase [Chloroflexota bacterium]
MSTEYLDRPLIRPKALRPGDVVAVVAPSGCPPEEAVARAAQRLEQWGMRAHVSPVVRESRGYLAGESDTARAAALEQALLDPDVAGVWCIRGGYGASRLLHLVDWDRVRRQATPKLVCGYSDITALHQAIRRELGWVSLLGPNAGDCVDGASDDPSAAKSAGPVPALTRDTLWRAWRTAEALGQLPQPAACDDWPGTTDVLRGGTARGPLVGGNLSLLAALCGTPWALRARGAILLLEDVHEAPYRIDRMLVQLLQAGCLDGVAGVAFGNSPTCEHGDAGKPSLTLREVLQDLLVPLAVPVVYGWPFGHTQPYQWTLPLGAASELEAEAGTLTVLEPACGSH